MKYIAIFVTLSLLCVQLDAQVGKKFPDLSGTTVDKKDVNFPSDTKGKVTLIGMAYSKKSDDLLNEWFQPVYTTFLDPPQVSFLPSDPYDVNIYFVGLLSGIKKAASGKVETKMSENLDPKLHPHAVISQVQLKPYKNALKLGKKDLPYFFVLDPDGKIIYATEGEYSKRKMDEITSKVDEYHD